MERKTIILLFVFIILLLGIIVFFFIYPYLQKKDPPEKFYQNIFKGNNVSNSTSFNQTIAKNNSSEINNSNQTSPFLNINLTVYDILIRYDNYLNRDVIMEGQFGGNIIPAFCDISKTSQVTTNDKIFYDNTGCIMMTTNIINQHNLANYKNGGQLKISATIILSPPGSTEKGKPLLNVTKILSNFTRSK